MVSWNHIKEMDDEKMYCLRDRKGQSDGQIESGRASRNVGRRDTS
jgi:hypothetical protein